MPISTIPGFTGDLPTSADLPNYEVNANRFMTEFPSVITNMNGFIDAMNIEVGALNEKSAVTTAATSAAQSAQAAAEVAAASAAAASTAANWVSGTTYVVGNVRRSLLDGLPYVRRTAGAGTTDPRLDPGNWTLDFLTVDTGLPPMRPSLLLDFSNSGVVDSRLRCYRLDAATYVDSRGALRWAGPNVARITHDVATGECLGLLTEPAATNLLLRSNEFSNAAWTKTASGTGVVPTVTAAAAAAPDGTMTASLIALNRGAGNTLSDDSLLTSPVVSGLTVAAPYSAGLWLKASAPSEVGKQVAIRHVGNGAYTVHTLTIAWRRVQATESALSTSLPMYVSVRGTVTTSNNVSFHAWNAQLETGTQLSSDIITGAATASRAAEYVDLGLDKLPALIDPSEGSMVVDAAYLGSENVARFSASLLGSPGNFIGAFQYGATRGLQVNVATATQALVYGSNSAPGERAVDAMAWKKDDFRVTTNGTLGGSGSDTAGDVPTLQSLRLGRGEGAASSACHIRRVALYTKALTTAQLQALSRI